MLTLAWFDRRLRLPGEMTRPDRLLGDVRIRNALGNAPTDKITDSAEDLAAIY
jgi:hypothetical protein